MQERGGGECRGSEGILVSIEGEWEEGRKSAGEVRGRVQGESARVGKVSWFQ